MTAFKISDANVPIAHENIAQDQSLAYGCLFNQGPKTSSETIREAKLCIERVQSFRARCKGVPIVQLRNRGIRNALAHFEERYLKAIIESHGKQISGLENLAISHESSFVFRPDNHVIKIKVYIYETDTFYLFNEKLELSPLRKGIEEIVAALGMEFEPADRVSLPKVLPLPAAIL